MTQYELPDGFDGIETAPNDGTIVNTVSVSGGYYNEMAPFSVDTVGWAPIVPLKRKRWRANYGIDYWFVGSRSTVEHTYDYRTHADDDRYELGNYFQTKDDAKAMTAKVRALYQNEVMP